MKRYVILAWLLAMINFALAQNPLNAFKDRVLPINLFGMYGGNCTDETDQYVPVFQDEFDQGQLDQWFWNPTLLNFHHAENGSETDEYNTVSNLDFPSGIGTVLRIRQTYNPIFAKGIDWEPDNMSFDNLAGEPPRQNLRLWPYRSGAITSNWKFSHGRYILNAKIPSGIKMWPAFWLSGDCADEIDVFEFMQVNNTNIHDRKASFSVHTKLNCAAQFQNFDTYTPNGNLTNMTLAFHTYSVDWDDFVIVFKVDNQVRRTFYHYYSVSGQNQNHYTALTNCSEVNATSNYVYDPQFVDAMMWIIVNGAVRNNATLSDLPRNFDIDYFRLFERIDCQETQTIHSFQDVSGMNFYTSYGDRSVTAGTITVDPTSTISVLGPPALTYWDPGDLLVLTAAHEIRILPGFEVLTGGNLIGQITPCSNNKTLDPLESITVLEPPVTIVFEDSLIEENPIDSIQSQEVAKISVFPNPTTTAKGLQILGTDADDILEIHGLFGDLKKRETLSGSPSKIDLIDLAQGYYLIRVWRGNAVLFISTLLIQ